MTVSALPRVRSEQSAALPCILGSAGGFSFASAVSLSSQTRAMSKLFFQGNAAQPSAEVETLPWSLLAWHLVYAVSFPTAFASRIAVQVRHVPMILLTHCFGRIIPLFHTPPQAPLFSNTSNLSCCFSFSQPSQLVFSHSLLKAGSAVD